MPHISVVDKKKRTKKTRILLVACEWVDQLYKMIATTETTTTIVAKALDGQRYPLPLSECLWE